MIFLLLLLCLALVIGWIGSAIEANFWRKISDEYKEEAQSALNSWGETINTLKEYADGWEECIKMGNQLADMYKKLLDGRDRDV